MSTAPVIDLVFPSEQAFLDEYEENIAHQRLTIRQVSHSVGTSLRIQLTLPGTGMALDLEGAVTSELADGVRVQLAELRERSQRDLEMCVAFLKSRAGRVLLVDDDIPLGGLFRQVLAEEDIGVLHVTTPIPALAALTKGSFDLVITDIVMPRMDGLEFADAVQGIPGARQIPVVFCSGADLDDTEWAAANRLGAAVLRKPVELERFKATVRGLITASKTGDTSTSGVYVRGLPDDTRTELVHLADIAQKRLKGLGVRTKRSDDRTQVLGELLFKYVSFALPFGSNQPIPRADMVAIGHSAVRCFGPTCLAALPEIPFLDLRTGAELEEAIRVEFERRESACKEAQIWLQRRQLGTRLDAEHFRCLGQAKIARNRVIFSSILPGVVAIQELNGRHVGDTVALEDRRVDVSEATTALDVEIGLENALSRVLERMRAPL